MFRYYIERVLKNHDDVMNFRDEEVYENYRLHIFNSDFNEEEFLASVDLGVELTKEEYENIKSTGLVVENHREIDL